MTFKLRLLRPMFFDLQDIVLDILHNQPRPPAGIEVKGRRQFETRIQM